MIDYEKLIKQARKRERFHLIPFLKYKQQKGIAFYIEVKNILNKSGLSIKKTIEKRKEKKTSNFKDFKKLNNTRQVITK